MEFVTGFGVVAKLLRTNRDFFCFPPDGLHDSKTRLRAGGLDLVGVFADSGPAKRKQEVRIGRVYRPVEAQPLCRLKNLYNRLRKSPEEKVSGEGEENVRLSAPAPAETRPRHSRNRKRRLPAHTGVVAW